MANDNDRRILRTLVDPFGGQVALAYTVETRHNPKTGEWETTVFQCAASSPDNQQRGMGRRVATATSYSDRSNACGAATNHTRVVTNLHAMWREKVEAAQKRPK